MRKIILSALTIIALVGCANNNAQQNMKRADKICDNQFGTYSTQLIKCYYEQERPIFFSEYPLIIQDFDSFYKKHLALMSKFDAGKISRQETDVQRQILLQSLAQKMGSYQEIVMEENKKQYCINLGAPPNSPKYYDCRKSLEQRIVAERMQMNALAAQQEMMQPKYQPIHLDPIPMPSHRAIHCNSSMLGNQLQTDCR